MAECSQKDTLQVYKGQSLAFVTNWLTSKGLQMAADGILTSHPGIAIKY